MTTAVLGFKIDSAPASSAALDLAKLDAAAVKLEASADALTSSAGALANALKRVGDETKKVPPVAKPFQNQDEHVRAFRAEVERLTMRYRPLEQATRQYEATVSDIQSAHKLGILSTQQMTQALDRERLAFERLKTSATTAGAAVKAANQNGRMGNERAAGINAGYQFQDIAVTAAMGMNPLMIGLQQGTQLASVLGTMERPVAGLAAAFGSLISPVTLVTVGLTAGVAALVQYFSTAESGSEKTARLFEEQNDTIRRAAELWGDAAPALKAYVDELDRADKIAQGKEAGGILAGRELEGVSENLDAVKREAREAFAALQGDPNNAIVIRDLRNAWGDLRERLDDGTATMVDLTRVQEELGRAVSKYGKQEVLDFSKAFAGLVPIIEKAIEAAEKFRGIWIEGPRNVQDRVAISTFTDGSGTYRPGDFIPRNVPTPGSRPLDLAGDPDPTNILNSDGRLTSVPIPGQKPNYFEIEKEADAVDDLTKAYRRAQEAKADFWLDLSFQERQAGRSAIDQQVATTLNRYGFDENLNSPEANAIRGQIKWQQAKELAKGFGDAFSSELISGSHDIGKSFLKGFKAAVSSEASKLWSKFFDGLGNLFADWVTGSKGGPSAGAGGLGTVASALVGGAANDNKSFSAPVGAVARAPLGDIASYISDAAIKRGIDPDIALRVARSEGGLDSWNMQSGVYKNGIREPSFGPFQLYKGGGLGNAMMAKTGLDPALAQNGPAGVDFALDYASKNGWGSWYGAGKAGIGNFEGIGANNASAALEKLASNAGAATEGLGSLGSGLGKLGQSLSTSVFPAAPAASGGGGGGLFSWLGGLFGGGPDYSKYAGLTGLFANGTNYAPGGMAIVGERGPELIDLPQGSRVFDTNRSARMMAGGREGGGSQRPIQNFYLDGARGDDHIRELARQGAAEGIAQYNDQQINGGFGDNQKQYQSRVA